MTSMPESTRRAYELGRLRVAGVGALPALVYLGCAVGLGADRQAFLLCLAMFVAAAWAVHRGGGWARGTGLGFALGILPFGVASFAQGAGHVCIDGSCMDVCMPACTAAGVVTGWVGSYLAVRTRGGLAAYGTMAALVLMAGAIGCRCVGLGSVTGMVVGLLVASAPAMPRLVDDTVRP